MSLDGELEVAVYIRNFHNLDLFQQGWYGVKVTCFWETEGLPLRKGLPSRVVQYAVPDTKHGEANTFWQINDSDNSYNTRPFRVRYSRQDVALQEMVSFKLFVTQQKPMDHGVIIKFDLLYGALDKELSLSSPPENMPSVASHSFRIVGGAWTGLHTFCPVTFDSWHFVYVEANVHAALLSFSQTLLPRRASGYEDALKSIAPEESSNSEKQIKEEIKEEEDGNSNEDSSGGDSLQIDTVVKPEKVFLPLKPSTDDLKLLRLLVASREKLTAELEHLSKFTDDTAFKIPVFFPSSVSKRLTRSQEASSDYGPAVTGKIERGGTQDLSEGDNSKGSGANEGGENHVQRDDNLSFSAEEWLTEREELTGDLSVLWNVFLNLHRLHQTRICQVLRERWEASRPSEAAQFVVGIERYMEEDEIFGMSGSDWVDQWRFPKITLGRKQQEERVLFSANKAELYRSKLSHSKSKYFPFQDTQYFGNTASQPIIFGERQEASLQGRPPLTSLSPRTEGLTMSQLDPSSRGIMNGVSLSKPVARKREGKHVVVFVHGFQGHHLDLRLIRNHWTIMDPDIEYVMSDINEDRTFDGFAQMGQRLAEEVSSVLNNMFSSKVPASRRSVLKKLSFVGHSLGNLIIRACIADEAMKPYLQYLHTFLSISGPHLGYLYSSNNIFNGGLWLLKRFKGAQVMHQLTFTDQPDIRECYLYKLSQMSTFEHFQHVVLLSSPQDRYVPYHSARIEMCPAAMRDTKRGAAYATMVQGCLSPLLKRAASEKRTFLRCDVNFDVSAQAGTINSLIGRAAHIEFLETDVYIRFILWYYRDCFV